MNEKMLTMQLQPFIDELGVSIDPFMPVEKLPAYKRVMVELLRAIVAGYHLIIIREISTVISEDELEKLFDTMRYYTGKGFTFLYVSYHFEEIQQVCTRAILMSEGSINLIFDKEQIKKGISEDNYIDYYNHVSQRLLHRARGNVPTAEPRKEVLYVWIPECIMNFWRYWKRKADSKMLTCLSRVKKYQITGQEKSHL